MTNHIITPLHRIERRIEEIDKLRSKTSVSTFVYIFISRITEIVFILFRLLIYFRGNFATSKNRTQNKTKYTCMHIIDTAHAFICQ